MVERRLLVIAGILALWSGAVVAKLSSLQLVHHQQFAQKARAKQEVVRQLPAPRGTIFDRSGQTLAMSLPSESVIVNPTKLPNVAVAADLLERVLHMGNSGLADKLKQAAEKGRGYFVVKHFITPEEAASVRALPIDGIEIESHSQRKYPKGSLAAHVLGGVDFSEHGNAGIEKSMEDLLHGEPGQELLLTDVKRRGIESKQSTEPKPGTSLTLTIDERLQFVAERELAAAVADKHASTGSVVVMDPTGDVLALASYPTFDPNEAPTPADEAAHANHATGVPFEPGSCFKVITLSAALETTSLRPETPIDCSLGPVTLFGRSLHEAHTYYGVIPMSQVLIHSSNIGAARVGLRIGQENMYEYVRRFGFGQLTGVPLPGESRGKLRRLQRWSASSLPSIAIGQEVSVTTLQLAQALCVIANGGLLVKPRLVLKQGNRVTPVASPVRVLKPETAFTMRQIMEGVVMPGGTGYPEARLAGYSAAGKTGSAQIFDVAERRYTHFYNGSFAGMAPLTNPRIVVVATLNGTHGENGYGGRAAAPVFHAVAMEALRIFEVPHDLPDDPASTAVAAIQPPTSDLSVADADAGPNILLDSDDDDSAAAGQPGAPAGPRVPNFRGMTMRDVLAAAQAKGLIVLADGSGVAKMQDPPPGAVLRQGERIRVRFSR